MGPAGATPGVPDIQQRPTMALQAVEPRQPFPGGDAPIGSNRAAAVGYPTVRRAISGRHGRLPRQTRLAVFIRFPSSVRTPARPLSRSLANEFVLYEEDSSLSVREAVDLRAVWQQHLNAERFWTILLADADGASRDCRTIDGLACAAREALASRQAQGSAGRLDHREQTPNDAIAVSSPGYLPLPAARRWTAALPPGRLREVRSSKRDEIVALIGSAPALEQWTLLGREQSDEGHPDVEQITVDEDAIFDPGDEGADWLFDPNDAWHASDLALRRFEFVRLPRRRLAPRHAALPFWYLKKLNAPLGAMVRLLSYDAGAERPSSHRPHLQRSDIDVVAVTTDRRDCTAELLKSIRIVLGLDPRVTIVVQSPPSLPWRRLARRYGATFLHVEEDYGLSAARNLAVEKTDRPLVFLMDDDFQLDERCRIDNALAILNQRPEISVLGGNLLDVETWSDAREREVSQGFAMRMLGGPPDILWLRLEDAPRQREFVNLCDYVESADIVDNFALFRRSDVFSRGVYWNPALKIGAEHQDLYIRLKQAGGARVARTNALKVRNVRVQSARFRRMRNRTDQFFSVFFKDLDLRSFRIIGERVRVRAQGGGHAWQQGAGSEFRFVAGGSSS